jgi:hypothetical protein
MPRPRRLTEKEWRECGDPLVLLRHLGAAAGDRKTLLLTVACLARISDLLPEHGRLWMAGAEAAAEGLGSVENLADEDGEDAVFTAYEVAPDERRGAVDAVLDVFSVRWEQGDWQEGETPEPFLVAAWEAERRLQADLVRDVFGNPFRPVTPDPGWLTPAVISLAQAAYDQRSLPAGTLDLVHLAVLADALEEVGCTDPEVLTHCRQEGAVHVRGCWALDLLRPDCR